MKNYHRILGLLALLLTLALLLSACGTASPAIVRRQPGGEAPSVDTSGGGPHYAAPLTRDSEYIAKSGWLELFLDETSMTAQLRGFEEAEWFVLPQTASTPLANAGACAVELDIIVHSHRITLNSQDHAVAYGNADSSLIYDENGDSIGVQVNYLLTPNRQTAGKSSFTETDIAFMVYVRYILQDGNFYVEADWSNASGNPDAFIETLGLMERFGALYNPGEDDFLLLPDGGGALLYPARDVGNGFSRTADLHFAVYGEDPTNPAREQDGSGLLTRDSAGDVLSANAAVYGARYRNTAFAAVIERGAAMATIVARQEIPGEPGLRQSAVGPRFTITPTTLGAGSEVFYRAAESYGGQGGEDFPIRICYRFFYGDSAANFSTMAGSLREQLINIGVLSSTKSVANPGWPLPLNLTLLGAEPRTNIIGMQVLTSFDQALDILMRLKSRGVDNVNIRYMNALGGRAFNPERVRPPRRLGGAGGLDALQEFCRMQSKSLFLDTQLLPGRGTVDLTGRALPLRGTEGVARSVRAVINRLDGRAAGISLGDIGSILHADYPAGLDREQVNAQLGQTLPSLSVQRLVMLDTGFFHVVRTADVVVNLPMSPQLRESSFGEPRPRYTGVPLLPMILHSSVDYSGQALNLYLSEEERETTFLRSIAYGACPALVWSATSRGEDDPLHFEAQLDLALEYYNRANAALADLRRERMISYEFDAESGVSTTRYSDGAIIYVNFSEREVIVNEITIPARDFVRIG